jgi:hypothetical protein
MKNYEKLQGVINTIELLEPIRPTALNASRLWGIYKTLMEVRDDLFNQEKEAEKEAEKEPEKPAEVKEDAGKADTK